MKKIIFLIVIFFTLGHVFYSQENSSLDDEFEITVKYVREHTTKLKQNKNINSWVFLKDSTQVIVYDSTGTINYITEFTYDNQGKIIESLATYTEVTYPVDYLIIKNQYLYDVDYNLTGIVIYGKDDINANWNNYRLHEFTYESSNLIIEVFKKWDDINLLWVNNSKKENTYDASNDMIITTKSYWNSTNEAWRFSEKHSRIFDNMGMLIVEEVLYWDMQLEEWYFSHTINYTYNGNFDILEELIQYDSGELCRFLYVYNGSLLTSLFFQYWLESSNEWVSEQSTDYYYDENNNLVHEYWQSVCPSSDTYHYYSMHFIGLPEESISNQRLLYPNPSSDIVYINASNQRFTVIITTTNGNEILLLKNCKNSFDVSNLSNGIYFVKILSDTNSYSVKLIKE